MQPVVLMLNALSDAHRAMIAAHCELIYAPRAKRASAIAEHGARINAVLTIGTIGLTAEEMQAMPHLELVCALGVGYERIDVAAARARGIALGHGANTNADSVADQAMALLLACVRQLPQNDRAARSGVRRESLPMLPQLTGKKLGLVGLGAIGSTIAKRASGFDMPVGYHARRPREGLAHRFFDSPLALAEWCEVLVLAAPGGPETHHMVNAEVLAALGPQGYLVNISRGSLVDTEALAAALRSGGIAGAGLDVYESEPEPPQPLLDLQQNLVLTPHVGGQSPESALAMVDRFIANLNGHFSGQGVVTPIP
ncbi:2-hydroxyacid dehydrogenase [Ideonella azotifigens]|uniref:2-hydroxyacid dehydrogenase n=2 Tax=Ideonella azotifigens TaxID=513160 RepID=A0ABN1KJJ6_9BURK|nr:2-hydroxyacid dehydrogenase [Ideonella azotifigens]MCD2339382.1 2-hydroxyacid dehydrogenase [Ideonella azotifigens]